MALAQEAKSHVLQIHGLPQAQPQGPSIADRVVDELALRAWRWFHEQKAQGDFKVKVWFIPIDVSRFVEKAIETILGPDPVGDWLPELPD